MRFCDHLAVLDKTLIGIERDLCMGFAVLVIAAFVIVASGVGRGLVAVPRVRRGHEHPPFGRVNKGRNEIADSVDSDAVAPLGARRAEAVADLGAIGKLFKGYVQRRINGGYCGRHRKGSGYGEIVASDERIFVDLDAFGAGIQGGERRTVGNGVLMNACQRLGQGQFCQRVTASDRAALQKGKCFGQDQLGQSGKVEQYAVWQGADLGVKSDRAKRGTAFKNAKTDRSDGFGNDDAFQRRTVFKGVGFDLLKLGRKIDLSEP